MSGRHVRRRQALPGTRRFLPPRRGRGEAGFTLVQTTVALVVVMALAAAGRAGWLYALEQMHMSEMTTSLTQFVEREAAVHREIGAFMPVASLQSTGSLALHEDVVVDSVAVGTDRAYLRVRHRRTGEKCSVDFSHTSPDAINAVQCFGGNTGRGERLAAVAAEPAMPDTVAVGGGGAAGGGGGAAVVLAAPDVSDPPAQEGAPGAVMMQVFTVANHSPAPRVFDLAAASSDPAVAAPVADALGSITIPANDAVSVPVEYRAAGDATAAQGAAIALQAADRDAPGLQDTGSFLFGTALMVRAPAVAGPSDVLRAPGAEWSESWTVRNLTNGPRMLRFSVDPDPAGDLEVAEVREGGQLAGSGGRAYAAGQARVYVVRFRLRGTGDAGTQRAMRGTAVDVEDATFSAAAEARVTTALVLASPSVTGPADRSDPPGSQFTVSWTVRNHTNAPRDFTIGGGLSAPAELDLVSTTNTGTQRLARGASLLVTATFRVRNGAIAGTRTTGSLTVADALDPAYGGVGTVTHTTPLVLLDPAVTDPGPRAGDPGAAYAASFTVENRTNATRSFRLEPSSSDEAVVARPAAAGDVSIPAFGRAGVTVTVPVERAAGGSTATVGLRAADRGDAARAGSAAFLHTTNTVVLAPSVSSPAAVSVDPGGTAELSFTVTNHSNVARSFDLVPGHGGGVVVGASLVAPASPLAIPAYGASTVRVRYGASGSAVGGSEGSGSLGVLDAAAPALAGTGSGRVVVNTVLRAPSLTGPSAQAGYSGETRTVAFTLTNHSNVARTFTFGTSSSNGAVVPTPGAPASVTVGAFGSAEVGLGFGFAAAPAADLVASVTVNAADASDGALVRGASFTATRSNRAPTVAPTFTPDGAYTFTATTGYGNAADADGVVGAVQWWSIDPSGSWSDLGQAANVSFTPNRGGTWRLYVQATDNNGARAGAYTSAITVLNRAPTAAPTFSPDGAYSHTAIQLSSNAADADGSVAGYAWYTIDPAGGWASLGGGANPTFTATKPGSWRTYVVVTDDMGAQAGFYSAPITVANRAPTVAPSAGPGAGDRATSFSFSANAGDMDGTVVAYEWFLVDPAGNWRPAGGSASFGTTLDRTGWWYGYVVAVDDAGARTGGYTGPVFVSNTPPAVAPAASPGRGTRGTVFSFVANASDPDGWVAGYEWYLVDPGGTWRAAGGGSSLSSALPQSGWWYGYVVAVDNDGGRAGAYTAGVYVNAPPTVSPTVSPGTGEQNTTSFTFGAGAADADGWIVAYEWYLVDPAGNWRAAGGASGFSTALDTPGWWYGYVVAVDQDGERTGGYTEGVNVTASAPPLLPPQLSGPEFTEWFVGDERAMPYGARNPNAADRVYCLRIRSADNAMLGPPGGDGADLCRTVSGGAEWAVPHTLRAYSAGYVTVSGYVYDQARPELSASASYPNRVYPKPGQPPVAVIEVEELRNLGHKVVYRARSVSSDPDGTIEGHSWTVRFDGVTYGSVSGQGTGEIQFEGPTGGRSWSVTLTVTDNTGSTATGTSSGTSPPPFGG